MKTAIQDLIQELDSHINTYGQYTFEENAIFEKVKQMAISKLAKEKHIITQSYCQGERDGIMYDDVIGYKYDYLDGYFEETFNNK